MGLDPQQRVLVIAPHPDDECLGAAGLMRMAIDAGHAVYVILLTSGDGFVQDAQRYYLSLTVTSEEYLHLGYERQKETVEALSAVGVQSDHIYFLGFPDGGLDALYRTHWQEVFASPTTNQDAVPYLNASLGQRRYCGSDLWAAIRDLMEKIQPTILAMPHALDGHPDHWATHSFGSLAALSLAASGAPWAQSLSRLQYLVHWPAWPMPIGFRPGIEQTPPKGLAGLERSWRSVRLSPAAVRAKREALETYVSQMELIKPYMLTFIRSTEVFEWDPVRRIPPGPSRNPEQPEAAWAPGEGVVFLAPEEDLVTRMASSPNAIRSWQLDQHGGYGYLRVVWTPRREGLVAALVIRLHWADGTTPWEWRFDTESGEFAGDLAESIVYDLDRTSRVLSVSWPLSSWQERTRVAIGVEAVHGDRVVGRSGYLAFDWGESGA